MARQIQTPHKPHNQPTPTPPLPSPPPPPPPSSPRARTQQGPLWPPRTGLTVRSAADVWVGRSATASQADYPRLAAPSAAAR